MPSVSVCRRGQITLLARCSPCACKSRDAACHCLTPSFLPAGKFAFIQLATAEMANASLALNGQVALLGQTLAIGRPTG